MSTVTATVSLAHINEQIRQAIEKLPASGAMRNFNYPLSNIADVVEGLASAGPNPLTQSSARVVVGVLAKQLEFIAQSTKVGGSSKVAQLCTAAAQFMLQAIKAGEDAVSGASGSKDAAPVKGKSATAAA